MEKAGKGIENEEERNAIKESGIGTPATRAAIIETLFASNYLERQKKSLVPTQKGLKVYKIVKDKRIADVSMTGMWENALSKIESGEMLADTFNKSIEVWLASVGTPVPFLFLSYHNRIFSYHIVSHSMIYSIFPIQ